MRPNAKNGVAVCLAVCLCLLVTFVNPEKTAELIEMLFGLVTRVGPVSQEIMY